MSLRPSRVDVEAEIRQVTMTMKIAVIADIHSNALALRVALEDLKRHEVDQVVHLGDAFNGPVDPAGVAELLRPLEMIHVRGNGERDVLAESEAKSSPSAQFARERLSGEVLEWIRAWPETHQFGSVFCCHGAPSSDEAYLLEEVESGALQLRSAEAIAGALSGISASLVLCAHSHLPLTVRVGAVSIFNPGSVGLPAYALASPAPHRVEVGSPCARYGIVESRNEGWQATHLALPYDHVAAARMAEDHGFPEWASALRTGYVDG